MPILFFGDLPAYLDSPRRVVTVGLNPSHCEFPDGSRARRFPGAVGIDQSDTAQYLQALNEYFRQNPYDKWFDNYAKVLRGADTGYKPGAVSTALHTDICSPVATSPTWNDLGEATQSLLLANGAPLWRKLIRYLQPDVILMSVAWTHTKRVNFPALSNWETIHKVHRYADGTPRSRPYEVIARWHDIDGHAVMLVFGQARRKPVFVADAHKPHIGERIKDHYEATVPSDTTG